MKNKKEEEIISFESTSIFRKWLIKNHKSNDGFWLRIFKNHSNVDSISYQEALEEALCFGWIDGQKKSYDEDSWIQKFTPRRPRSIWSKRNTKIVEMLIKKNRIHTSGIEQVQMAKKDGRWSAAYESSKEMKIPADFLVQIKKHKKAYAFFQTLKKANLYSIAWRLHTAKKEQTRIKRMAATVEMLKNGEFK